MTQATISLEPYLNNVVGKALRLNKQALALTIPHILEDYYHNFSLIYNEDKTPVLCDKKSFWKIVCGRKSFDISPSFTKGIGRQGFKVNPIDYLVDKGFDGVCFVDFTEVGETYIKWTKLNDLPDTVNGVYKRSEIFE